jgi:hypothetical protein
MAQELMQSDLVPHHIQSQLVGTFKWIPS